MAEIRDGTDAIRARLLAFMRKGHLAGIARDVDIGISTLEAFVTGGAVLPLPTLQKLAALLLDAQLDPQSGLLRSKRPQPQPLGAHAPKFDPKTAPFYQPVRPGPPRASPGMAAPSAPRPPRAGWAAD